jgi:hypothetical protein
MPEQLAVLANPFVQAAVKLRFLYMLKLGSFPPLAYDAR